MYNQEGKECFDKKRLESFEDALKDFKEYIPYKDNVWTRYSGYCYQNRRHFIPAKDFFENLNKQRQILINEFGIDSENALIIASNFYYDFTSRRFNSLLILEHFGFLEPILNTYPTLILKDHNILYSRCKYLLEHNNNIKNDVIFFHVVAGESNFRRIHYINNKFLLELYPLTSEGMDLIIKKHEALKQSREKGQNEFNYSGNRSINGVAVLSDFNYELTNFPEYIKYKEKLWIGYQKYVHTHKQEQNPSQTYLNELAEERLTLMKEFGYTKDKALKIVSGSNYNLADAMMERLLVLEYFGLLEPVLDIRSKQLPTDYRLTYARIKYLLTYYDKTELPIEHILADDKAFDNLYRISTQELKEQYPLTKQKISLIKSRHNVLKIKREKANEQSNGKIMMK